METVCPLRMIAENVQVKAIMDEPSLWNSDRRDRPRAHEIRTLIGCIKSKCEWYAIVY